jgi:endonuclease YncB( thermonuclease family)
MRAVLVLLIGWLAFAAAPAQAGEVLTGRASATDGDSLILNGQRIRVHGVDAFEAEQTCTIAGRNQACGGQATRALAALVSRGVTVCVRRTTDAYGRIVASCRVGDDDVGASLVRRGHALAFRRYSQDYVQDEDDARSRGAGVWADGSRFQTPWDWRAGQRDTIAAATRASPIALADAQGCAIKGNINRQGARIYHLPGSRWYSRTRAEAVFCTIAEAEAAGFRAPRG